MRVIRVMLLSLVKTYAERKGAVVLLVRVLIGQLFATRQTIVTI